MSEKVEYRCDGFDKNNEPCFRITTEHNKHIPNNWITLDLKEYKNNQHTETGKRLVSCGNSLVHFCCNQCFINYFFYEK